MPKKPKVTTGKAADREMKAMESKNGKGTLTFTPKKAKKKK